MTAKNWAVPGGDDPTPTETSGTMDKHMASSLGVFDGVGNVVGTITSPSIQTTEEPDSLPGDN